MKMVMAVVPKDEAESVINALVAAGHTATFTESRGGMLRQAQYTLFIGVDEEATPHVLEIVRESCHSHVRVERGEGEVEQPSVAPLAAVRAKVGGAVVFVWELEQFAVY
jgi:uncharacterized protein YaaQ